MTKSILWIAIVGMGCCISATIGSGNELWLYAALFLPFAALWVVA